MKRFKPRELAEIGVALSLAVVLGLFRVFRMPQGGSISLEMVPIFYIAFQFGFTKGFVTGILYGVLQLFLGAFIVHPLQLILDYPLAYGLLGIAGIFQERIIQKGEPLLVGGAIFFGSLGRFFSHFFSGIIFFRQYAPEGTNPFFYSFLYNVSYLVPEAIITIVVFILLRRILFQKSL